MVIAGDVVPAPQGGGTTAVGSPARGGVRLEASPGPG